MLNRACWTIVLLFMIIPPLASGGFDVQKTLKKADVAGGLVVVVGLEDVAMLTDIADAGPYLVHGLDADAGRVEKARAKIFRADDDRRRFLRIQKSMENK